MTDTGSGEPAASSPYTPRGPGVTPPFAAPPVEGRGSRLWFGLGVGALAVVLCCGGGIAAAIGLTSVGGRALTEQVDVVVGDYFEALKQQRYEDAYQQLCDDAQGEETPAEFSRRLAAEAPIASYEIGRLSVRAIEPVVPVRVVYDSGADANLRVHLSQDTSTGGFEVCGVDG
jgi:hypothetical protein